MKYKIIAVDMDGTLLNDDKSISDYNLRMIEKAANLGVKFVIASGRIPSGLKFYEDTLVKNQPMICSNGAKILDERKKVIYSKSLSKEAAFKVIDIIREDRDTYYHFYSNDIVFSEYFSYGIERFYKFNETIDRKYRMEIRIVPDAKKCIDNNNLEVDKIVVIDTNLDYLQDLRKRIETIKDISIFKSEIDNLEISGKGISKGKALKILAEHYGISLDECIAIGNDENDMSMIQAAGLGVAVQNARNYVKEIADFITERDNNNGAIGEVIEKFIFSL